MLPNVKPLLAPLLVAVAFPNEKGSVLGTAPKPNKKGGRVVVVVVGGGAPELNPVAPPEDATPPLVFPREKPPLPALLEAPPPPAEAALPLLLPTCSRPNGFTRFAFGQGLVVVYGTRLAPPFAFGQVGKQGIASSFDFGSLNIRRTILLLVIIIVLIDSLDDHWRLQICGCYCWSRLDKSSGWLRRRGTVVTPNVLGARGRATSAAWRQPTSSLGRPNTKGNDSGENRGRASASWSRGSRGI